METEIIQTKIGLLQIMSQKGYIYNVKFIDKQPITNNNKTLIDDVNNYFNGLSTKFSSKYIINGTPFQKLVWAEIEKISYGQTKSYGEIAKAIGQPTSYRAVANACGQNNLALLIPCHRVVGKNDIGGYHWGVNNKKWLIDFEKGNIKNLNK
jgi:O-6-methylguanine DNA methyltransferase